MSNNFSDRLRSIIIYYSTGDLSVLRKSMAGFRVYMIPVLLALFSSACGNTEQVAEQKPDMPFEKIQWNKKNEGEYLYRKQMVKDIMNNYKWTGMKKDSVVQILGEPDAIEEGNLRYDYEKKPFLGGFGTKIEALVFELTPDSTVRVLRFNGGGWD